MRSAKVTFYSIFMRFISRTVFVPLDVDSCYSSLCHYLIRFKVFASSPNLLYRYATSARKSTCSFCSLAMLVESWFGTLMATRLNEFSQTTQKTFVWDFLWLLLKIPWSRQHYLFFACHCFYLLRKGNNRWFFFISSRGTLPPAVPVEGALRPSPEGGGSSKECVSMLR